MLPLSWVVVLAPFFIFGYDVMYAHGIELGSEANHRKIVLYVAIALLVGIGVPILTTILIRKAKHQLGADGHKLHVKFADGRRLSFPPEQVCYDGKAILYRDHVFPIYLGKQVALYEDEEIKTFIAPLLTHAKKLGARESLRYKIAHRGSFLRATVIYAIVTLVVVSATSVWYVFS